MTYRKPPQIIGFALAALLLCSATANATVIIDVTEVGGDVVFAANGSLDLSGASFVSSFGVYDNGFIPGGSNWYVGPGPGGATDTYAFTSFDGPFGTIATFFDSPTSVSGDNFYIWGESGGTERVGVASGYVSGSSISSGMVFASATIASFSMTPGTYNYTLPNDTITLNIGGARVVPEPATLALLGLGLAGVGYGRKRKTA